MSRSLLRSSSQVGQVVSAGDTLLVLEAMKMETPITAPCGGKVAAIKAAQSSLASAGALLVVLQEDEDADEEEEAAAADLLKAAAALSAAK